MRIRIVIILSWVLCLSGLSGRLDAALASDPAPAVPPPPPVVEQVARAFSTVTGVAISPLLGVGAVGAYDYFRTPPNQRSAVPWYAHPLFWIPALLLVAVLGLKDILGTAAPAILKKPFDLAELIENKISALIAAGALIPLMVAIIPRPSAASGLGSNFAMINGFGVMHGLLVVGALAAFVLVWFVCHTIHILILLSPFPIVDLALKGLRLLVLALVVATSFANAYLGAAFALVILLVCYVLAGWAFRLTVLGHVFGWDLLTRRRKRFIPTATGNWMFTAVPMAGVPIRTYGCLDRDTQGRLSFGYRPGFCLPRRSLALPVSSCQVGRGLLYPEVLALSGVTGELQTLFVLPPRYRTHEAELARMYGFDGVCDRGLLRGFKLVWRWVRDCLGMNAESSARDRNAKPLSSDDPGLPIGG